MSWSNDRHMGGIDNGCTDTKGRTEFNRESSEIKTRIKSAAFQAFIINRDFDCSQALTESRRIARDSIGIDYDNTCRSDTIKIYSGTFVEMMAMNGNRGDFVRWANRRIYTNNLWTCQNVADSFNS